MEENKVQRAQMELAQVKQEIDRRVADKEDEFNNTRYSIDHNDENKCCSFIEKPCPCYGFYWSIN